MRGKWDLYNIKLALEAKDRGLGYDSIAMYLIDCGRYGTAVVKDVMREGTIELMFSRFMVNSPYRSILSPAHDVYAKGRNMNETIAAIDRGYYGSLARAVRKRDSLSGATAKVMGMEIEMVNALTLIRAKNLGFLNKMDPFDPGLCSKRSSFASGRNTKSPQINEV